MPQKTPPPLGKNPKRHWLLETLEHRELGKILCKLSPREKEIAISCLDWHNEFNRKKWKKNPSFHNIHHAIAVMYSAQKLIQAALKGNDPLEIKNDLERWNRKSHYQIEPKELTQVAILAFALHDTGNILKTIIIGPESKPTPQFLEKYTAEGAEERSQEIAEKLTGAYSQKMPEENFSRFLPLIQHLINETKFNLEEKAPFGVFTRVIDQVGSNLFNTNTKRTSGLLQEIYKENPKTKFTPHHFFNFTRKRFEQLIPSKDKRNSILKIWGKKLPKEKTGLPQEPIEIGEWLRQEKIKES